MKCFGDVVECQKFLHDFKLISEQSKIQGQRSKSFLKIPHPNWTYDHFFMSHEKKNLKMLLQWTFISHFRYYLNYIHIELELGL